MNLPDSFSAALNKLKGREQKVRRDPALRIWYNNKSNEYEEKGYIRKLSQTEAMTKSSKTYYIPH